MMDYGKDSFTSTMQRRGASYGGHKAEEDARDGTERTADVTERDDDHDVTDELVALKTAMEDRFATLEARLRVAVNTTTTTTTTNNNNNNNTAGSTSGSKGTVPSDPDLEEPSSRTMEARLADLEAQLQRSHQEAKTMDHSHKELHQSNCTLQERLQRKEEEDAKKADDLRNSMFKRLSSYKSADGVNEHSLSEGTYSFLFCSPVWSRTYWIGMTIMFLQFGIFTLFFLDLLSAQTIPPNVEPIVRWSQVIAISVTFMAQQDVRTSLRSLIYREGVHEAQEVFHAQGFSMEKFIFANVLMFLQGVLGVIVGISLIVMTDNVFDLILNFTAIMFVSELDELVFVMAKLGYIGKSAEGLAKKIQGTAYQERDVKGWTKYLHIYAFLLLVVVGYAALIFIIVRQASDHGLPTVVKVQFGDVQDPNLGLYSGCFRMKSRKGLSARVNYVHFQEGRGQGLFRYCVDDDVRTWIFTPENTKDPCDNPYLRSAEEQPTSFDVLDTRGDQWLLQTGNPVSDFQMSAVDEDNVDDECGGEFRSKESELCPILTMDSNIVGFSDDRDWSRNFNALMDGQGQVVNFFQHPVYVGEFVDDKDGFELIFFTGRRWVLTGANSLLSEGDPTNKDDIISLFRSSKFWLLDLPVGTFDYISEAVSFATDRGTPLGLRWYFTRYTDDASATFPLADVSRPTDAMFKCGKCNAISNPCRYEGICREDGTCECKHGATGKLCDIKPLQNGVCNRYFNRGTDQYDGGDCCVASCPLVSCGIGYMFSAFDQELQLAGNGFPDCKDPEMVPMTIVMNSTINEDWGEGGALFEDGSFTLYTFQVRCGDDVPLRVVLDPWIQGESSETLFLADQTRSCTVTFSGIQSESELSITYQLLDGMLSGDDPVVTMGDPVNVRADASFDLPGLYSRCLKATLANVIDIQDLYSGSYQDLAMAFLDNEISPGVEYCGGEDWLTQRFALASTSFSEVAPEPWINENDHCLWSRVTCKNSLPVVLTYDGSTNGPLTGNLASEIGLLTHLERLDVFGNSFDGTLPTELGALTATTALGLPQNSLRGTIPTQLGSLTALNDLMLAENRLTGTIPSELGNLNKLTFLGLQSNRLVGPLPTEMGDMESLARFDANTNRIGGPIPSQIGMLSTLNYFVMLYNQLSGKLPTELGFLESMQTFILGSNALTGTIPTEFGKMTNLNILWLATNQLSGPIPNFFGSMQSLMWLHLGYNQLTGKIPSSFASLPATLQRVRLEHNRLTGEIPSDVIVSWRNLNELRLSDNLLVGELPTELGLMSNLASFQAANNEFRGPIPTGLFDLPLLSVLHLDSNRLTGEIGTEVGRLTNLSVLRLHNNSFVGPLPTEIGLLSNLVYLDLGNNNFSGTLPTEIALLTDLKYLRLNGNQLEGPIPSQLSELANLEELDMTDNQFDATSVQQVMVTLGLEFTCNETAVEVLLQTDNTPGDVFWQLQTNNGTVVAEGTPEPAVQYFDQRTRLCVPADACSFIFGDRWNNGGTLATITRLGNVYTVGEESFPGGSYENMLSVNICE